MAVKSGASLECGALAPLWYELRTQIPKRCQGTALQGGARFKLLLILLILVYSFWPHPDLAGKKNTPLIRFAIYESFDFYPHLGEEARACANRNRRFDWPLSDDVGRHPSSNGFPRSSAITTTIEC